MKKFNMSGNDEGSIPWWLFVVVILGAALMLVGVLTSQLAPGMELAKGEHLTHAARVYADYLFARNLPLAIILVGLLLIRACRMLAGFMVLTACIQVLDGIMDASHGRVTLVPIMIAYSALFLICAWRLLGEAPWHLGVWRDPLPSHEAERRSAALCLWR